MKKNVLYLGDSPVGGPANYLLGILKYGGFSITHIDPSKSLSRKDMSRPYSLIIVSDYSRKKLDTSMKWISEQVKNGTGFAMIGGWGSFNGFRKGYKGSLIEKILPVSCLSHDDRRNLGSGAFVISPATHSVLRGTKFKPSPVIVGYNEVRTKKNGRLLLRVRENASGKVNPLFVIGTYGRGKTAAWTSDLAPHWCGGLVDWGTKRKRVQVSPRVRIEVGDIYLQFFSKIFKWLAGGN